MTEEEAREQSWEIAGSRIDVIAAFVDLLVGEATRQNLIAASTVDTLWSRHILDSLQLLRLAGGSGTWVDVGSGAGLPGVVIACAGRHAVTLIEPRRRRADFLAQCIEVLGLQARVEMRTAQTYHSPPVATVSARAVARVPELLAMSRGFSDPSTRFVLPRGRSAQDDVVEVRRTWHGMFHVEQSLTNPDAGIIVAHGVRPR